MLRRPKKCSAMPRCDNVCKTRASSIMTESPGQKKDSTLAFFSRRHSKEPDLPTDSLNREDATSAFSSRKQGKVFLVGAGPGDIGLVTLRAQDCIARADVIVHDSLVNPLVFSWAREDAEIINMGKKGWGDHVCQETISAVLVEKGLEGKTVVRLKGGDPFIFGRGGEEAQELKENNIPFEVVPGITSAVAVSAYSGIPLTHRDLVSQATLLTGHPDSRIEWDRIGPESGTLVIYMGLANLSHISKMLIEGGWSSDTPTALISRGTRGDQEVLTSCLNHVAEEAEKKGFGTPALVVIGHVVGLRNTIKWFERKPLFGQRILVTGSKQQAFRLAQSLEELGAVSIMLPTFKVTLPQSWDDLDRALDNLHEYDYIVFSSINSVKYFFRRFAERDKDIRELGAVGLGAIGENTIHELSGRLLKVDLPSPQEGLEDFFKLVEQKGLKGKRILFPGCKESKGQFADFLKELGNKVITVDTYRIADQAIDAQRLRAAIVSSGIDLAIFTSPTSVRNFCSATRGEPWEKIVRHLKVATVGPLTAKEALDSGLQPSIMPERFTVSALIAAVVEHCGQGKELFKENELSSDQSCLI
jgi:uroporphyrinogen III methyltransferase/synthase